MVERAKSSQGKKYPDCLKGFEDGASGAPCRPTSLKYLENYRIGREVWKIENPSLPPELEGIEDLGEYFK